MSDYRVLRGIAYGKIRAEAGDVVSDIPASSAEWLLEQGIVEPVTKPTKQPKREPVSESKGDE